MIGHWSWCTSVTYVVMCGLKSWMPSLYFMQSKLIGHGNWYLNHIIEGLCWLITKLSYLKCTYVRTMQSKDCLYFCKLTWVTIYFYNYSALLILNSYYQVSDIFTLCIRFFLNVGIRFYLYSSEASSRYHLWISFLIFLFF